MGWKSSGRRGGWWHGVGAVVDEVGQLVGGDDAEQSGVQGGVPGDGLLESAAAPGVRYDPYDQWKDAGALLVGAGVVVGGVAVAGGDDAGGVLGGPVDFQVVVVLVVGAGDGRRQVGAQCQALAAGAQVGAPAVGFGVQLEVASLHGSYGLGDDGAGLGDGQLVRQEAGGQLVGSSAGVAASQGSVPAGGQRPHGDRRSRLPAADAALQAGDQVVGAQFVQVAQALAQSGAQRGVGVGGQAGQLGGGGEAVGRQQSQ